MILYHKDGVIIKALYAVETGKEFQPANTSTYDLVESSLNRHLCADIIRTFRKRDSESDSKYYIDVDGDLAEKENWTPHYED